MSSEGSDHQVIGNKERPAALVVCSYLGWPITGGVAAAIRQLIHFLHTIGLAIYCTTFKVNNDNQNEFREFDVNLIYPDPPDVYRFDEENISWLHHHETYFPEISKVERVKMIFGFSMVTSYQASAIRNRTFPNASFYLVNPYRLDTPPSILGYNEARFNALEKSLAETIKEAKAVFSIGSEIFNYFDSYYDSLEIDVNHLSLMLTPDNELFKIKRRCKYPETGNFHILTFFDINDISELSSESTLAKAMNYVAGCFHKMKREPPKWTIVSVPKGSEDAIKNKLDPHPHLKIIYKSFDASKAITLLKQSHLLLVPPSSTNSVNLSLSTIATGTPLLVPLYSPCHKAIMGYLPKTDPDDIVVDMKGGHTILGDKIIDVMTYYTAYHKRASTLRDVMELKVNEVSNQTQMMLEDILCKHEDLKQTNLIEKATIGQGEESNGANHGTGSSTDSSGNGDENHSNTNGESKHQREQGNIRVRMVVKAAAPKDDKPVSEIENDLFSHESTQTNADNFMDGITESHPDLHGEAIEEGCLNFIMRCGSTDAADALWNAYSSGRLDRMADKTFLSIPLLDDIGARMLSLETFIDYQEYLQCKQEIADREAVEETPHISILESEGERLKHEAKKREGDVMMRQQVLNQKKTAKSVLTSFYINDRKAFDVAEREALDEKLSLRQKHIAALANKREEQQKLTAQRAELDQKWANMKDNVNMKQQKLADQIDGIDGEISSLDEQNSSRTKRLTTKMNGLNEELRLMEDADEAQRKQITDQIDEINAELTSTEKTYNTEMERLTELRETLEEDLELAEDRIEEFEEIDTLTRDYIRLKQGIVPKYTVRRLSREGNGPGEVWSPYGLTINHNGQVLVSDRGDGTQPGSVKTVAADTAQIISTITFHGLPNTFRPTDVKMSKNNLYYIADDGNKCILVCDAKSRLKQIIDIGKVGEPMICLGPDNTVFVADYNGRVIKYSKAGEMISSKQLSKPYDLTMNSKYQLIVSCEGEHCIYVLDSNLNTLHTFGHEHLEWPRGVSVDAIGENIYVADDNNVKIFSAQGEYLTDVTVDGWHQFIAVFADGRIVYTNLSGVTVRVIYT